VPNVIQTVLLTAVFCVLSVLSQVLLKLALRAAGPGPTLLLAPVVPPVPSTAFWFAVPGAGIGHRSQGSPLRPARVSALCLFGSLSCLPMAPGALPAIGRLASLSGSSGAAVTYTGIRVLSRSTR
jgi:hypothetical protein